MTAPQWWRFPFSLAAGFATASIGAHFLERAVQTEDEWSQAAFWTMAMMMGVITVMEGKQVWEALGLISEK